MTMTKRDFEAMAESIMEAKREIEYSLPEGQRIPALAALKIAARELATACARQYRGSYGFNRARFMDACGFGDPNGN